MKVVLEDFTFSFSEDLKNSGKNYTFHQISTTSSLIILAITANKKVNAKC